MDFYTLTSQQTVKHLKSNLQTGLSLNAVERNLHKYGMNKMEEKKSKNFFMRFLSQFSDVMVIILLIAAGISFVTAKITGDGDYIDPIIILTIVIINAFVGVIQESKAEKAIDALKKMVSPKSQVIRESKEQIIPSEYLVPGDIIYLDTGDFVPADTRILQCHNLQVKEDALTGESVPVSKFADVQHKTGTPIAEIKNMLFSGSFITSGRAVCIVTQTGMNTQVGHIAKLINNEKAPLTPLQKSLAKTGKILGFGAIAICIIIFILGLIQGINPLEIFMISISLAVAAIPEGLPAVVTIVLAMGVKSLAKNKAIIRKLPAVETLGSADIICSDKTGTLTQNKMTVRKIVNSEREIYKKTDEYSKVLTIASLCCNSKTVNDNIVGDPTENAIINEAMENGIYKNIIDKKYTRIGERPFDSKTKMMTTIHKLSDGRYRVICKGAPEIISKICNRYYANKNINTLDVKGRRKIAEQNESMAKEALRVLAVAYKDVEVAPKSREIEKDLIFTALIGMIDPPREGVKESVQECLSAGIKPIMITGDHIVTAKAIGRELNIFKPQDKAMSGDKLNSIKQEELDNVIEDYSVFARVSPEHKVKIVKAFQKKGKTVAMTGDGVNDAPALKVADIGCAMGKSGTAVAKQASDMILTDDNFSTIVCAVKQGRTVFENIKKTIHFLLSSNMGEIISVLSAFLLSIPSPLLAIQLLWINLVTDSLPALALGVEPPEKDIMKHKKEGKKNNIFTKQSLIEILIEGSFIGSIAMLAFTIGRCYYEDLTIGRTMAFCVLSFSQLIHAFNVRSERSLFEIGFFSNKKLTISFIICAILQISVVSVPVLSQIFKTSNLNFYQWITVVLLSISPLVIVEIEKFIENKLRKKRKKKSK